MALGTAELRSGDRMRAAAHLHAALRTDLDPDQRVAAALVLAQTADPASALEVLERAAAEVDGDHALRLDVERTSLALYVPEHSQAAFARAANYGTLAGETPVERLALAEAAFAHALSPDAAAELTTRLADRASGGDRLVREQTGDAVGCFRCCHALLAGEAFELAERQAELLCADARERGSMTAFVRGTMTLARIALERGECSRAIAHGEATIDVIAELVPSPLLAAAAGFAAQSTIAAHVVRGDLDDARRVLATGRDAACSASLGAHYYGVDAADVAQAEGDHGKALEGYVTWGEALQAFSIESRLVRWRAGAALACFALGRGEDAVAYADEQLAVDRTWNAAGGLGAGLRVRAVVGPAEEALG